MEDFRMNNSSPNNSFGHSSSSTDISDLRENIHLIRSIVTYIVIGIGFPLTLVAIHSVYSLVRSDHAAPVYDINLIISDIIQLILLIMVEAAPDHWESNKILYAHETAVLASTGFMVFLALERYMLIAHPLWYRLRQSTKMSVWICVVDWVCSIVVFLSKEITVIAFLLPMPLFIFLLAGTVRALTSSVSVPFDEKRRVVIVLALSFIIYSLLLLPTVIQYLGSGNITIISAEIGIVLLRLSTLADLALYVFIRKGTADKLLSSLCCYRREKNNTITTVSGRDGSST